MFLYDVLKAAVFLNVNVPCNITSCHITTSLVSQMNGRSFSIRHATWMLMYSNLFLIVIHCSHEIHMLGLFML